MHEMEALSALKAGILFKKGLDFAQRFVKIRLITSHVVFSVADSLGRKLRFTRIQSHAFEVEFSLIKSYRSFRSFFDAAPSK